MCLESTVRDSIVHSYIVSAFREYQLITQWLIFEEITTKKEYHTWRMGSIFTYPKCSKGHILKKGANVKNKKHKSTFFGDVEYTKASCNCCYTSFEATDAYSCQQCEYVLCRRCYIKKSKNSTCNCYSVRNLVVRIRHGFGVIFTCFMKIFLHLYIRPVQLNLPPQKGLKMMMYG